MKFVKSISGYDRDLVEKHLGTFVPREVFDIHAHPYSPSHFPSGAWPFLSGAGTLGCEAHTGSLTQYMPVEKLHGLYFGMPHREADRQAMNAWVASETRSKATASSRCLMVASPEDDRRVVGESLRAGLFCGIKVYHCYASRPDTMQASVIEYAPEWMWEILHETQGIMMLHIVRDGAISDEDNQKQLRRLCRSYPRARLVLAHVARSFNYRHARNGLHTLGDLDNVVVDTSAIGETETFRAALKALGPRRMLWGSDFAVSEMRGRCVTTGADFFWLHPEVIQPDHRPPTAHQMTLVGIESLLALQEACEDTGMTQADIEDIFLRNALRLLEPHLDNVAKAVDMEGPSLWKHSQTVISGGTGLLSKRAGMFGTPAWPSYFSRCKGCEVWDLQGRRYIDFAGGIGAVLLGYGDEDVTLAVERRLALGNYCSLVSPDEVRLADRLLALHPWAGKVRFARGGGEAMSVAVRIARSTTGRSGIAFCGYHGWHDWYLAANLGETRALDGHLLPGLAPKGVPRELSGTAVPFVYNDLASFEKATAQLGNNLAAVVMEPMRSEFPKDDFVAQIASRCRALGAVFVVDEITSGLRYGFPGALAALNVEPDLVVYAKALSNGFPFAAIIGRENIMRGAEESFISSSYWTDGVGPAAALAVLEKMQRLQAHQELWQRGEKFHARLKEIARHFPSCNLHVGGMPVSPTLRFDLDEYSGNAKALFIEGMLQNGFLASSTLYLMYAHQDDHLRSFLDATQSVLDGIQGIIKAGKLPESGHSNQTSQGFARLA